MDEMSIKEMQFKKRLEEDPALLDRILKCESALDVAREMDVLDIYFRNLCIGMFQDADLTLKVNCPNCKKEQKVERKMGILLEYDAIVCKCLYCDSEFDLESAGESLKEFRENGYKIVLATFLEGVRIMKEKGILKETRKGEFQGLLELSKAVNKKLLLDGLVEEDQIDKETGEIRIFKEK